VSIAQYLDATGQDQQDYINGLREGAVRAVLADLGLRAVVIAEEIEATDEELQSEIDRLAERVGEKPNKVRRDLERRGMLEEVRSDIARGKALQFLVDHANVVDKDGNAIDLALPDASGDDDNGDETVEEDESSEQEEGTA
jgi:trigger factor